MTSNMFQKGGFNFIKKHIFIIFKKRKVIQKPEKKNDLKNGTAPRQTWPRAGKLRPNAVESPGELEATGRKRGDLWIETHSFCDQLNCINLDRNSLGTKNQL